MSSANYSITPGAYTLTTETERPNSQTGDPQLEALAKRLIMQRLQGQLRGGGGYVDSGPRRPAPQNSSSPAPHGGSIFGQNLAAEGTGANRYLVPTGLGAQMIPGMGADKNDPRQVPNNSAMDTASLARPSMAGVGPSSLPDPFAAQQTLRGGSGTGVGFEEARFANALQDSDENYARRREDERRRQLALLGY